MIDAPPRPEVTDAMQRLDAQIATVDVMAVAVRVAAHGPRAAIQTSTVEIIAMAVLLTQLCAVSDQTYDLFVTADQAMAAADPTSRRTIRAAVTEKINEIGRALEALGYGQEPTTTPKEN